MTQRSIMLGADADVLKPCSCRTAELVCTDGHGPVLPLCTLSAGKLCTTHVFFLSDILNSPNLCVIASHSPQSLRKLSVNSA